MDDHAIAAAIAARFAPALVTPPSGYQNVTLATADMPTTIVPPCVIVWPPEEEYAYATSNRVTDQEYPVRFYLGRFDDLGYAADRLARWRSVLRERLVGNVQLGQSGVSYAVLTGSRSGLLTYATVQYTGIEFACRVHLSEGVTFTA